MNNIKDRKKLIYIILAVIIVGAIIAWQYGAKNKAPVYDFVVAGRSNITQEVSVTGKVKPMNEVGLSFEKQGKIAAVKFKVGDVVKTDQVLSYLENTDLIASRDQARAALLAAEAQLSQAEAARDFQQAKLDELLKGAKSEEVRVYQSRLVSAQSALADAQSNYNTIKSKTDSDLTAVYDSALSAAAQAVTSGINSLLVLTDIQSAHFAGNDQDSVKIADAKAAAVKSLLGADDAGRWNTEYINQASGGAKKAVATAQTSKNGTDIDTALTQLSDALSKIKIALNTVPLNYLLTATDKTNLNLEKATTDTNIGLINAKQEAVNSQKALNNNSLNSAEAKVNDAKNAVTLAEDELALKVSYASAEQIRAQQAQVRQAEASIMVQSAQIQQAQSNVDAAEAMLKKTIISSPIDGIVSKMDAKVGEITMPNVNLASVISENKFEVEAYVPEADIAKVKIEDPVKITFDAFLEKTFSGKVFSIDPAQQLIGGVINYQIAILLNEDIPELKSGMTANADIQTGSRENVIVVPKRSVIEKDDGKYIKILVGNKAEETKVEIGLESTSGEAEIISGISVGDKVITYEKQQ